MQSALTLARRVTLSKLRPTCTRYSQQLLRIQGAFSFIQPRIHQIHLHQRSFHASSPAHAKNLNFNLADIGEGIAEVLDHFFD